jgi:putative ATP-binding cassette transporter
VAVARVILHKPQWVFMDEATSALDEENQASMLALFENELKGASVLSIGHRPGLEEFHTRTLHIRKTSEGAVLLARPMRRSQPKTGPRWIGRFRRRLRPAHAQEG